MPNQDSNTQDFFSAQYSVFKKNFQDPNINSPNFILDTENLIDSNNILDTNKINTLSSTISQTQSLIQNNIQIVNEFINQFGTKGVSDTLSTNTVISKDSSVGTDSENQPLKTYNVRSPYVEISINGRQIYPNEIIDNDINNLVQTRKNFQDLELSMPLGGVAQTITGSLKLYSLNPMDLLSQLFSDQILRGFDINNISSNNSFNSNSINFGINSNSELDPETGLSTCTIRFGWALATGEGSSEAKFILTPKIPFLVTNVSMSDPGGGQGAEFTLSLQDKGSAILQNSSDPFLAVNPGFFQEQLRFLLERILGLRLFTLDDLLGITPNNQDNSNNNTKTFFTSEQNGYLKINKNIIWNVVEDLLENIRCRWYPINNANDTGQFSKEIENSENVVGNIEQEKNLIDSLLLELDKLKNIKNINNKDEISSKINQIQAAQSRLEAAKIRYSSKCKLLWVPNFPKDIKTTSNNTYSNNFGNGAYFLLPEILVGDVLNKDIPLIYGPGGSKVPYFYGAAMNVLQRSLENSNQPSQTLGDVVSLSANYDSLLTMMANNTEESVQYHSIGDRLSVTNSVADKLLNSKNSAAQQDETTKINIETQNKINNEIQSIDQLKTNIRKVFSGTIAPRYLIIGDNIDKLKRIDPDKNTWANNRSAKNGEEIKSTANLKLKNRLLTFLNWPINITMTVLGDPFLIRQGIGAFELINYFPSQDGKTQILNSFLSGVYIPTQITHRISDGEYLTTLSATKTPDAGRPKNALASTIIESIKNESSENVSTSLLSQVNNVDLTSKNTNNFIDPGGVFQINDTSIISSSNEVISSSTITSITLGNLINNLSTLTPLDFLDTSSTSLIDTSTQNKTINASSN